MAHLILIVEAACAPVARGHSLAIDPAGGGAAFDVGLSETGEEPPTHYWVGWEADGGRERDIRRKFHSLLTEGRAHVFDTEQVSPAQVLLVLGLQRVRREGPGPGAER